MMRRRELLLAGLPVLGQPAAGPVLAIGGRRELLVDEYLLESMRGAELRLATPVEKEIVLRLDRPHEGPFSAYFTVLHDEGLYRVYYRGVRDAGRDGRPGEVTCYAQSKDGVHFEKPDDNVILRGQPPFSHNFCPFIDGNPKGGARYKALSGLGSTGMALATLIGSAEVVSGGGVA